MGRLTSKRLYLIFCWWPAKLQGATGTSRAMYHIMRREYCARIIFLCEMKRYEFVKALAQACRKTGWQELSPRGIIRNSCGSTAARKVARPTGRQEFDRHMDDSAEKVHEEKPRRIQAWLLFGHKSHTKP